MSAFVRSTFQLMHGYMAIVNTIFALSKITWVCVHMSALASTQVIIMCVHRQSVCLSTFTTKSPSCMHVYMYVHSFVAFDPWHLYTCQSSTQVLCGVDNNMNISCHNSHRLYWHVYTCQHQLQPKSTSFVYKIYVYAHLHQSSMLHASIWAFDLSTNAWVHVNGKHYAWSKITWMCAHKSVLASKQVIIMCVGRQQPVCLSTFTNSVLRPCLHVRTFRHSLLSLHVCTCQSSTKALCRE